MSNVLHVTRTQEEKLYQINSLKDLVNLPFYERIESKLELSGGYHSPKFFGRSYTYHFTFNGTHYEFGSWAVHDLKRDSIHFMTDAKYHAMRDGDTIAEEYVNEGWELVDV